MAGPEYEPVQPKIPEGVVETPTQHEIPADIEQATGAKAVPAQPSQIQDPVSGQVVAQPTIAPADPQGPSVTIPVYHDEQEVEEATHGDVSNSATWKAVGLLRRIHMAVRRGFSVIFNQN